MVGWWSYFAKGRLVNVLSPLTLSHRVSPILKILERPLIEIIISYSHSPIDPHTNILVLYKSLILSEWYSRVRTLSADQWWMQAGKGVFFLPTPFHYLSLLHLSATAPFLLSALIAGSAWVRIPLLQVITARDHNFRNYHPTFFFQFRGLSFPLGLYSLITSCREEHALWLSVQCPACLGSFPLGTLLYLGSILPIFPPLFVYFFLCLSRCVVVVDDFHPWSLYLCLFRNLPPTHNFLRSPPMHFNPVLSI